ncbi:MAG: SUMF1/EgtB/PvdO family nonheme iron enzyme, partial [Spirochaetota bacterium]
MKRTAMLAVSIISFVIMLCVCSSIPAHAQGTTVSGQSAAEERPAFGQNEALLKITIHLPKGYKSPEEKPAFWINTEVTNPGSSEVYAEKLIMMPKGTSSYTAYAKISASGGRADCVVSYIPGWTLGLLEGYASENGTSLTRGDFPIAVKPGEIREISLEAIQGVSVSGVIQLPASAKPGKRIRLMFRGQNGQYPKYYSHTEVNVSGNTRSVPYSILLPKGEVFDVTVADVFAPGSYSVQSGIVSTTDAGFEKQVKNIAVADPVKITFADAEMEKLVRAKLARPTGDLYDYMVNNVILLEIDGTKVKSLEDLPQMKSLSNLRIKKFTGISPFLPAIGGMRSLNTLEILITDLPDLSFLKNLKNLTRLCLNNTNTSDISPVGELSGLLYLDISDTAFSLGDNTPFAWRDQVAPGAPVRQITDHSPIAKLKKLQALVINCTTNENLNYLAQCESLSSLTLGCGWKVSDISFITRIKKLNYLVIEQLSAYADISSLLSLNSDVIMATDMVLPENYSGKNTVSKNIGKEFAERLAAVHKKAQSVLAAVIKPGMSDLDKELAIHDWITANVKYDNQYGNHPSRKWAFSSAYGGLVENLALCGGYARTFELLMNSAGVECHYVSGLLKDSANQQLAAKDRAHAWNVVKLDNEYYFVDPTLDTQVDHNYFNVSSMGLAYDHEWDEERYPKCTGEKYRYMNIARKSEPVKAPAVEPAPAPKVKKADMVLIKGGAFKNSKSNYYGKTVTLPDFYIGAREITQKEWVTYMDNNPSTNKGDDLPVENVSWNDCIEYCNRRSRSEGRGSYYIIDSKKKTVTRNPESFGYRLPTDMEWEYAASGGILSGSYLYSGGDSPEKAVVCGRTASAPVESTIPNELGLYDMSGNVAEWCWDAESNVKGKVSTPKDRYYTVSHVVRGGSYARKAD